MRTIKISDETNAAVHTLADRSPNTLAHRAVIAARREVRRIDSKLVTTTRELFLVRERNVELMEENARLRSALRDAGVIV